MQAPLNFVYEALPGRVIFGRGRLDALPNEAERPKAERVLILCMPDLVAPAERAAQLLGIRSAGIYDKAMMHVPANVAATAKEEMKARGADCLVSIGGGSTTGLGKAIALDFDIPLIAVPTTFAGSEMTPIWGLTADGMKKTGRNLKVLPKAVIYDPELLATLPVAVAGPSGMNAIAHCVEALYSEIANPIVSMMAEEGIRALAEGLPALVRSPNDIDVRGRCLYGAWLGGTCLGMVGMALHHKLCHTLGGTWNLPHAETHAIVIPHVTAFNAPAAPEAIARVARALGKANAAQGLYDLLNAIGAPTALKDIGMKESELDRAAELATENPYYNPRTVDAAGVRKLLDDAYFGRRPA